MKLRTRAPLVALLCGSVSGLHAQAPLFPTPFRGPTPTTLPTLPPRPRVIPPPALTVTATFPIYEYNKMSLPMRIDNYPFEELDLNALPHDLGDFRKIPGITYGSSNPRRDDNGSITFSVMGYFASTGSRIVLHLSSPSKSDTRSYTVSAAVTKSPRTTYTVNDTWAFRDKLHPQLLGSGLGNLCNDTTQVHLGLGLHNYNGKLSFLGRSGPAGTACVWGLTEMLVHNAVISATWRVIRSGPGEQCKAETDLPYSMTRGTVTVDENGSFVGSAVLYSDAREVSADGVVFATDNTSPVTVLKPTRIEYSCPITLGTDVREIRFVLDRVTLVGPPGIRFP